MLWEEYERDADKDPLERRQRVEQEFHNKMATTTANKKVGGEESNPLLKENLFTPKFLLVTFIGTVVGERIGHVLTSNLPMFPGGDFVFIFKLGCAALGAFGGYKLFVEVSKTTVKDD
jgi:prolipoprotein diacylglyceryltransferase